MTVIAQYKSPRQLPVKPLVVPFYRIAQDSAELAVSRNDAERRLDGRAQIIREEQLALEGGEEYFRVYRIALMVEGAVHLHIAAAYLIGAREYAGPDFRAYRTAHAVLIISVVEASRQRGIYAPGIVFLKICVFARAVGNLIVKFPGHVAGGDIKALGFDQLEPQYLKIEIVVGQALMQKLLVKRKIEQLLAPLGRAARRSADAFAEKTAVYLVIVLRVAQSRFILTH